MIPRRRTAGVGPGRLVVAAAAAGVLAAAVHLLAAGPRAPVALRAAPVPPAAPAPRPAPDTAERASATPAPPPPAPPSPPPAPPVAATPAPVHAVAAAVPPPPAPLSIQPPGLGLVAAQGALPSPAVTFTITSTARSPVTLGAVSLTAPGFRIAGDGCSHIRLAPGGRCTVTVRWSAPGRGHAAGLLVVPVTGARPATARLEGTVR